MAVYLVTWDLNREKLNYSQARVNFLARLDKFTSKKDSGLDSVRFVDTTWDAEKISNYLKKMLDSNDRLFVTKIHKGSSERFGWLSTKTWDWIKARS